MSFPKGCFSVYIGDDSDSQYPINVAADGKFFVANSSAQLGWDEKNASDFVSSVATQAANKIFSGPSSGGDSQPTFRSLVASDIPSLPYLGAPSAYSTVSSPDFSTPRTPNTTRPTWVTANVTMTVTVLTTRTITAQVDTGEGYVDVQQNSLSLVATTSINNLSFWVPANASYQLTSSGAGTSINYIRELTF